jgi:hypothetical protein
VAVVVVVCDGSGAPSALIIIPANPAVLLVPTAVRASVVSPITKSTPVPTVSSDTGVPSTVMAGPPSVTVCVPISYPPAEFRDNICPLIVAIAGIGADIEGGNSAV